MSWSGALDALLIRTGWLYLLQLIPLMPGLQLLWNNFPGHHPDGVVGILLQRGRSNHSGVRWRGLKDSPRGLYPFLPLSLLRAACQRRGGQQALFHIYVLRGEEAIPCCGLDIAEAQMRLAGVLMWTGEAGESFLLWPKLESVRWRAELWNLRWSVPAGGADMRWGRVLRAAILGAGLVRTQGRVLWRSHHEISHTASLGQPASPSAALWAEALLLSRCLTFGKSAETRQVNENMFCFVCWCSNAYDFSVDLKDWEYWRRMCSSGVDGALMAWLWRRAEFLINWERGILPLSEHTAVPDGLLQTARTERTLRYALLKLISAVLVHDFHLSFMPTPSIVLYSMNHAILTWTCCYKQTEA